MNELNSSYYQLYFVFDKIGKKLQSLKFMRNSDVQDNQKMNDKDNFSTSSDVVFSSQTTTSSPLGNASLPMKRDSTQPNTSPGLKYSNVKSH